METVIITRHAGLIDYLAAEGIAPAGTPVLAHATPDDVRGKRVIGVLPLHLAALAAEVVSVDLDIPAEWRGVDMNEEQVRACSPRVSTYTVLPSSRPLEALLRADDYRERRSGAAAIDMRNRLRRAAQAQGLRAEALDASIEARDDQYYYAWAVWPRVWLTTAGGGGREGVLLDIYLRPAAALDPSGVDILGRFLATWPRYAEAIRAALLP